jgi:hypothetical protein
MLIHEKLYEKHEITYISNEGNPWKYIDFLFVFWNYFLATHMTLKNIHNVFD